jgi:hypothetical protein
VLITILITVFLVTFCFFMHHEVMKLLARRVNLHGKTMRHPVMLVLCTLFAAHLIQVLIYAGALAWMDANGLGDITGDVSRDGLNWWLDHFYFSIASYSSLGIGDILPHGYLRLVAGIECLNGLVLIAWSASFTYLVMDRAWGSDEPLTDE